MRVAYSDESQVDVKADAMENESVLSSVVDLDDKKVFYLVMMLVFQAAGRTVSILVEHLVGWTAN